MTETTAASAPLGSVLVAAARWHRGYVAQGLAKLGLKPGQELVLMSIERLERPSQREIAQAHGVDPATVAVSVRRLEAAGFVRRSVDEHDSRVRRLELTRRGRAALPAARAAWREAEQAMRDRLPAGGGEQLADLLAAIAAPARARRAPREAGASETHRSALG